MTITILHGDALTMLRSMPSTSVHCCVTSPPYWGLRDYGVPGQLGLEKSPQEYVARMVEVFREVRRVLRDDGTLWLNLGDSYAGSGKGPEGNLNSGMEHRHLEGITKPYIGNGLKPKDLCGIPWRVAFALQDDGWYLRAEIIWAKRAPMPESVTDRPTRSHEQIFLLTKSARYYYDQEAVKEQANYPDDKRKPYAPGQVDNRGNGHDRQGGSIRENAPSGRNQRDVWLLSPEPYPEAHFATFHTEIPRRAILAGTSERGCCPNCGGPWRRVATAEYEELGEIKPHEKAWQDGQGNTFATRAHGRARKVSTTTGWTPTCTCRASYPDCSLATDDPAFVPYEPVPCTVLDPFLGSGTTLAVAVGLGRHGIGIELNADYIELAERRIEQAQPALGVIS